MNRFSELTDAEILSLSNDELNVAIRVEAIERGIKPPIPLSEAVAASEFRGYQLPAEHIKVWKLKCDYHDSRIGWLSEEEAIRALSGAVEVEAIGYPAKGYKLSTGGIRIEMQIASRSGSQAVLAELLLADTSESEDFAKVVQECMNKFSSVRQEAYDKHVNSEKRAEYLRLANGDETIAKAFWAKVERGEFPEG